MAEQASDPVVIVGYAVEAPGGVDTLDGYWSLLAEGREAIGPFPRDRGWSIDELLSLGGVEGWGEVSDAGGFLAGAAEFDPGFFGITPREATAMDPQQRVALRVAWRALENAGINPGGLSGETAGCYIGASGHEYGPGVAVVSEHSGHLATGKALGAIAGRISYHLGVVGPSLTVDTACASALTAVHLAANAIKAGECDWALAGGVCVMGSPAAFYEFSKLGGLSPDGHLRAYSDEANGTLWAEGSGVFVLEPASRARALGHRVLGEIRATGVNHVGRTPGIAVPSAQAQERLIARTLDRSGVRAGDIGIVEGHGTGTKVGDPIELQALFATYGAGEARLGSVKSNLGHAQAAAGALALAKVLLCGEHGQVAPSLHADKPTTGVDWTETGLRLAAGLEPWSPIESTRYGAVSSFGYGGTNAHAIIAMPA